ncbi:hypothetical protein PRNP1_001213 [Phytophthora ramorum]
MRIVNADERQLVVADEQLSSLEDVVRVMPTAQYLNVAFNSLNSLSGLEQMKELRSLDIAHNAVESLQEVSTLSNLLVLKCSSNQVADLSWVAGLSQLEELWLRNNRVESAQLAHLQKLTALQTLIIHPNPCTERDDYVLMILKVLPWLQRVDTVVVTEELRVEARHAEERVTLDSGATDYSLFSLSGRSEDPTADEESTVVVPSVVHVVKPPQLKKQMTAEEFMRAFPVQDFIPLDANGESTVVLIKNSTEDEVEVNTLGVVSSAQTETKDNQDEITKKSEVPVGQEDDCGARNRSLDKIEEAQSSSTGISALLDSVLTLPTFDGNSFLTKKKKLQSRLLGDGKPKVRTKPKTAVVPTNESLPFRQDEEYSVMYPNSTVTAIQVRYDGSAIARWPSGNVAVSVDFETTSERSGYRAYAAHKDGQLALSFDPAGVGFLNAYPSGKTLISTTSDGNGLLFDVNNGAIVRQWDTQGRLRDAACQSVGALGEEPDGSLLCSLSDNLAVRVQLTSSRVDVTADGVRELSCQFNPVLVHIYFAAAPDIRHVFVNRANRAEPSSNEACDRALGKSSSKDDTAKCIKAKKAPPIEHMDLLSSIRAAVAGL